MAQLVKNTTAMWETWVRSVGWEGSLEKGKATHCSILAWRIPLPWNIDHESDAKSWTQLSNFHFQLEDIGQFVPFSSSMEGQLILPTPPSDGHVGSGAGEMN